MSKKVLTQRTALACAVSTATALLGMTFAMQAHAFNEIPLTLDAAQAVAEADQQSSISAGISANYISGEGKSTAEAWNGYDSAKVAADVDVNLVGGEGPVSWSVQGTDLGTPIPEVTGSYGVASKWDVDARVKRFRHVSTITGIVPDNLVASNKVNWALAAPMQTAEQVHDVYAVNGRLFITPQATLTGGYQIDARSGEVARGAGYRDHGGSGAVVRDIMVGLDDEHHQVKVGTEYVGSNWTVGADYYLSKYVNHEDLMLRPVLTDQGIVFAASSLDPSNTLHRLSFNGSYQPTDRTTLSMRGAYSWSTLDSDYWTMVNNSTRIEQTVARDIDASIKIPEFAVGISSRPFDPLSVKLDYSYRKVDQRLSDVTKWYEGDYTENKVTGSATYNFGKGYSAKVHGKYMKRDYVETIHSAKTYSTGLELRKRLSTALSGSIGYTYSGRDTDWREGVEAFTWNLMGYDQHAFNARLSTNPTDALTISLLGSLYKRDYKLDKEDIAESSALQSTDGFLLGVDVDWAPTRDWNVFAFYNYDYITSYERSDWYYSRGKMQVTWDTDIKSASHTFGLGFGVHPQNQPWKVSFRYVFGYDTDKYDVKLPVDNHTKTHYAAASLDYQLNKSWTLMGNAVYGHGSAYDLHSSLDDVTVGEHAVELTMSPNYNAFGVFVGVKYLLP